MCQGKNTWIALCDNRKTESENVSETTMRRNVSGM